MSSVPAPSLVLRLEAQSVLPAWLTLALVAWIAILVGARALVLLDARPVDRALHRFVGLMLVVTLLRQPWVQGLGASVGFSVSDVRLATHVTAMLAAVCLLVAGIAWQGKRIRRSWVVGAVCGVLLIGVLLAVIAWPARERGIAVEELTNWRTALYLATYSLITPLCEVPALLVALGLVRDHTTRPRVIFGAVVCAAIGMSMLDHLSRVVVGVRLSLGDSSLLLDRASANDYFILPIVAVLVVLALPSILTSVSIRRGGDRSAIAVRRLRPLWAELIETLPEYGLAMSHSRDSSVELEHRMRIEIEDCVAGLSSHFAAGAHDSLNPSQQARDLAEALARFRSGQTSVPSTPGLVPDWVASESAVDAVAAVWGSGVAYSGQR